MRAKTLAIFFVIAILVTQAAQAAPSGWILYGTFDAVGFGATEEIAEADAEAVLATAVSVIESTLLPGSKVGVIIDSTDWDSPEYRITFSVYLKI